MKTILDVLWPELRPYKGRLLAIVFLGALISALKGTAPYIMQKLTEAWNSNDSEMALIYPTILAGTWCAASFFRFFQMFWMKFISEKISVKLRTDLMRKYLYLNLSYVQSFASGTGGLISRMISDITYVQVGTQRLADIVREPFMVVFSTIYMLYVDWTLLLFVAVTLPLTTAVIRSLSRSIRKYSHKSFEQMEDISKTLKESLDGSRIVQSYNLQEEMFDKFHKQSNLFLESRRKIVSREELVGPASEAVFSISMALILFYIGNQIFMRNLTVADFMGFSFAIGMLGDSVKKLQDGFVKLQQAVVALDRYHSILSKGEQVHDTQAPVPFPASWTTIEFKNVSFRYDEGPDVISDLNLTVKRGEVIALVGGSGGGKSTLVNLLGRFYEPSKGSIYIDGIDIKDFALADLRNHVSLVSQDVFLFSDTVEYNIQSGNFGRGTDDVIAAAKLANAHNFISQSERGYQTIAGERGSHLSGGQKQRISIARAILKDAPILILDEATSALDSESEKEVQQGLSALMQGRTTFVVAHRLSTISHADRILVLEKGKIVESGTHEDLIGANGFYKKLLDLQMK